MEVSRRMVNLFGGGGIGRDLNLNLKETELCLGLPGGGGSEGAPKTNGKRGFSETVDLKLNLQTKEAAPLDLKEAQSKNGLKEKNPLTAHDSIKDPAKPPAKAQVVGWPPVRSYRKNMMANKSSKDEGSADQKPSTASMAAFVKVSMDGAPYLRKVDLKMYNSYDQLSDALGKMFSSFTMGKSSLITMKCKFSLFSGISSWGVARVHQKRQLWSSGNDRLHE
ncbi:hypothetical protein SAY86_021898 [Trapa natans]|uniref:Auxin-responsive protein n=1 Tax=Trapa natans TaxID=22666 RepID=A0AAN7MVD8_TRANT|nr:hypothetical protein SAY86_021898 [Trapa natans]